MIRTLWSLCKTVSLRLAAFTCASRLGSGECPNNVTIIELRPRHHKAAPLCTVSVGEMQILKLVRNWRIRSSVEWLAVSVLTDGMLYNPRTTKCSRPCPAVVSVMIGRSIKHHKAIADAYAIKQFPCSTINA